MLSAISDSARKKFQEQQDILRQIEMAQEDNRTYMASTATTVTASGPRAKGADPPSHFCGDGSYDLDVKDVIDQELKSIITKNRQKKMEMEKVEQDGAGEDEEQDSYF